MKKYIFALALVLSIGAHAFEVSGNHFEGKFKIDSMTVGENEVLLMHQAQQQMLDSMVRFMFLTHLHKTHIFQIQVPGKDMEEA